MTADRRAELLALADRVEREAPSRELNKSIALVAGWTKQHASGPGHWWVAPTGEWGHEVPDFTGSIDAAASLMPQNMQHVFPRIHRARAHVYAVTDAGHTVYGEAPTEPQARTAAALRAIAEETDR